MVPQVDNAVAPANHLSVGGRIVIVVAAMAAAAAVWWPAHQSYRTYPFIGTPPKIRELEKQATLSEAERRKVDLYSFNYRARGVGYVVALFGAAVGGATLLVSGFVAGAPARGMLGLLVGAGLGGALGFAGGALGQYVFELMHQVGSPPSYAKTATFHLAGFAPVGLAVGLAFFALGLGGGEVARRCVGGIVGAALAAALFVPLCGLLSPMAKTAYFVPDEPSARLYWFLLNAACIAIGASTGALARRSTVPSAG